MPSEDSRTLFISDEAYKHLQAMATAHSMKLHKFIAYYLALPHLYDNRPEDIKEEDEARREVGMPIEWQRYGTRRRRLIKISRQTLAHALVHHHMLGMYSKGNFIGQAVRAVSKLLEAIGSEWVTNERP